MVRKGKQIRLNTNKNKEQVDFVHKPNQHLIIELRSNLTIDYSFYEWIIESINRIIFPNQFSIHEFISPLATGTLDMV